MAHQNGGSAVHVAAVTDVNHHHEPLRPFDPVEDSIAADAEGISVLQLAFQGLPLERIARKVVEGVSHPSIQFALPFRHTTDDAFRLVG